MTSVRDRILRFIADWDETSISDTSIFNDLALALFEEQFSRNEVYRRYCEAVGVTPGFVRTWTEIPALPVSVFKDFAVTTFPVKQAVAVFRSTGTTRGAHQPSQHYFRSLDLYDAAAPKTFRAFCLPDLPTGVRLPMLVAFPPPSVLPHSSLSYMLDLLVKAFGNEDSGFFVTDAPQWDALAESLKRLSGASGPVCLLGTTLHFAAFFQYLRARNLRYRLPAGSRLMDTGGSKAPGKTLNRARFLREVQFFLGISPEFVINEYGMTELTSQCYDGNLFARTRGGARFPAQPVGKICPPWLRVVFVDPPALRIRENLKTGLIRVYDLANADSVLALQTEDIGVRVGKEGWDIAGRLAGAEPRGCSIAAEDLLREGRGSL